MLEIMHHFMEQWALSLPHLNGRMSFIAGPRQVGKTTMVENFLSGLHQEKLYYNWDLASIKRRYAQNPIFFVEDLPTSGESPLWVGLDEIHKYPKWKNILKGYYDEWKKKIQFIVTGSARLDFFRRSGDSLVGRYFLFKMLPLGVSDFLSRTIEECWYPGKKFVPEISASLEAKNVVGALLDVNGFPESFLDGTKDFLTRWQDNHISLILREDLRDLTKISELAKLQTLLYLLPERVGSPLSLNSLRQPLECAHGSITLWLEALTKVYLIFSISPWSRKLTYSILKEKKYYFWDWSMVSSSSFRFENFVAVGLQRAIAAWNEWGKGVFELHYLRSRDGREVDFAICDQKKVHLLVEVKEQEETISPHLYYFKEKTGAGLAIQVISKKGVCVQKSKDLWLMGAERFFSLLP